MRNKQLSSIISCIALVCVLPACGNFEGNIEELRPIKIDLTVTASYETLTVMWNAVKNAAEYEVYCNETGSTADSPNFKVSGSVLSQTITGLENGTTYYFCVKVVRADGARKESSMVSAKPIGNMEEAVTVTTGAGGSGELDLEWSSVAGADEYEIYYAAEPISNINNARSYGTVSTTWATISGLDNGIYYNVWVKPKNAHGYGGASPIASGITLVAPGPLTVTVADKQVTLSWGSLPDAASYNVYYSTSNSIPDPNTDTPNFPNITGLSRTITDLTNGTTYHFWVAAVFTSGIISGPSFGASGTPLGIPDVTVSSAYKQLLVEWGSVVGATRYDVYYSMSNSMPASPAFSNITELSQEIPSLNNGTTYYIWVKAKYSGTDSNSIGMKNGTPGIPSPGLYKGARCIGNQNLNAALPYILSNAGADDDYYIVLGADESISNTILDAPLLYYYDYHRTVEITLLGYSQERTINLNADTVMFYINDTVRLILGENITLKGRSTNNYSLVCLGGLEGGNLIINDGAKITGNNAEWGGAVYIATGNLTMNGGSITGNTASFYGGGVYVSAGKFTMTGGIISGNTASSYGGGVYIGGGTFQKQSGGTIYGNETGAGVNANNASSGAAVYKSSYPHPSVSYNTTAGPGVFLNY